MLQCLTEELESAQHASQSLEQQLFELRESHVMDAEVEQKQLQEEAEVRTRSSLGICRVYVLPLLVLNFYFYSHSERTFSGCTMTRLNCSVKLNITALS